MSIVVVISSICRTQGLWALWSHLAHCSDGFSVMPSVYRAPQKVQSSGSRFWILTTMYLAMSSRFFGTISVPSALLRYFKVFSRCLRLEQGPCVILFSMFFIEFPCRYFLITVFISSSSVLMHSSAMRVSASRIVSVLDKFSSVCCDILVANSSRRKLEPYGWMLKRGC